MAATIEEQLNKVLAEAAGRNTAQSALCGQTLMKLFRNVLDNPCESKYRTLNRTNKVLSERLFSLKGAEDLLFLVGWEKDGDCFCLPVEASLDSLHSATSALEEVAITSATGPIGISNTELANQILTGRREKDDWFARVFGFKEWTDQNYTKTKQIFSYNIQTGVLKSRAVRGREFMAGFFSTPSLEELRARVDLESARKLGEDGLRVTRVAVDVGSLHGADENHGAVFQCASQFNCLEHSRPTGKAENGITCYQNDRTQGPACALACPAGTVVRNYFAFNGEHPQSVGNQVNNLKDVESLLGNEGECYFQIRSGYTLGKESNVAQLKKVLDEDERLREEVRKKLRIGVQSETEVLTSGHGRILRQAESGLQLVTQVYCSALSVGYSGVSPSIWETFAIIILEAAYEATLLVGIENALRNPSLPGSRKVFLTSLGGGSFGNSRSWIESALSKATEKFKDVSLEVYMVSK